MKKSFPGYFTPSKEQFAKLWGECLFVPDTNVLLDLYRYSPATREELLEILRRVTDRLWVPHQVVLEYLRNRPDVILTQVFMYDKAKNLLDALIQKATEDIEKDLDFRLHPSIEKGPFLEKIKSALAEVTKELDEQRQKHPDLIKDDIVLGALDTLLDGKVGEPYTPQKLADIYKEGEARYRERTPPGYSDAEGRKKKEGRAVYGDLILWFQIIDKANETKKPIILITNETTEDWWWSPKGRILGPRPELIEEMEAKAKVRFYAYSSDRFMSFAQEYLKASVKQEAIDEARKVRRQDVDRMNQALAAMVGRAALDTDRMNQALAAVVKPAALDVDRMYQALAAALKPAALDVDRMYQTLAAAAEWAALDTDKMNRAVEWAAQDADRARSAMMSSVEGDDSSGDSLDSASDHELPTDASE